MSKRLAKDKVAASSASTSQPTLHPEEQGTTQLPAAQHERQLDSDYDDAPEQSSQRTLRAQVQALAQNQSETDSTLRQILQRITDLAGSTRAETTPLSNIMRTTIERDTPMSVADSQDTGHRYSKKLPDPTPLSDGKDPEFLSWKLQIQGKFRCNADHFSDEEDQMIYLFNRTSGDAQKHLQPRFDDNSQTCFVLAKEMLAYLARIYVNLNY